jgi:hypothetical protein
MTPLLELIAPLAVMAGTALAGAWWLGVCRRAIDRRRLDGWREWQKAGLVRRMK